METAGCFDRLAEELQKGPYSIVDILPEQVPQGAAGRYFAVEKAAGAAAQLRRDNTQAQLLLCHDRLVRRRRKPGDRP